MVSSIPSSASHLCELNCSPWDVKPLTHPPDRYSKDEERHWGEEAPILVKKDVEDEHRVFEERAKTEAELKTELGTEHEDYNRCNSKTAVWQCKREAREGRLNCEHHLAVKKSSYYKCENSMKRKRRCNDDELEMEVKKEEDGERGRMLISNDMNDRVTTENDYIRCNVRAQGWQCDRQAKDGRLTCEYHLNMQKSRDKCKKVKKEEYGERGKVFLSNAVKDRANKMKIELRAVNGYVPCNMRAQKWQCNREAKEGRLSCEYHLNMLKPRKKYTKVKEEEYGDRGRFYLSSRAVRRAKMKTELRTDEDYLSSQGWQCLREAEEGKRTCEYHLNLQKSYYYKHKCLKDTKASDQMWGGRMHTSTGNEYVRCNKKSGHGWQCDREAMRGRLLCEHHTGMAARTNVATGMARDRKRVLPAFPPVDYYYYSGFSPLHTRGRRKIRENEDNEISSDPIDVGRYSLTLLAQVCADLIEHEAGTSSNSAIDLCSCPGVIPSWGAKGSRWYGRIEMQDKDIVHLAINQTSSASTVLNNPRYDGDKDYKEGYI